MVTDNPNRYRITRDLTFYKIVTYFALLILGYNLIAKFNSQEITTLIFFGFISALIILFCILYYLHTRKIVEYDDIEHVLYVLNPKKTLVYEIPVAQIEKILYSSFGFDRLGHSYIIIFRDFHNQRRKIQIHTIPFRNDIKTIIIDTKQENPNLITRNWSIG